MDAVTALLDAALDYARGRRPIFPVKLDKKPYTQNGFKDATTEEARIRAWWTKWPDAGIATPTGPTWFVLDVDDPEALAKLEAEHGPLPETREVVTPRPGRHIYLLGEATNARGSLPGGIDVRGSGGYVLLPPSPHQSGGNYEWKNADVDLARRPAWLAALLFNPAARNGHAAAVEGDIPDHERNQTLASMAGTMRRRGFSKPGIAAALLVENRDRCKPPLPENDVHKIAHSIARYKPSADALGSLDELTGLFALDQIGRRIDRVKIFGRGSLAVAHIGLDDGTRILLDTVGKFLTCQKLSTEIALQTGAPAQFKQPEVLRVAVLLNRLAEHYESVESEDRAWELGAEYLMTSALVEFAFDDQASRWRGFAALDEHGKQPSRQSDIVLVDENTGSRYVRIQWLTDYLRHRTGPGDPDRMMKALETLGWRKPGSEGRIKATSPGPTARSLQWAFYVVEAGWEDR